MIATGAKAGADAKAKDTAEKEKPKGTGKAAPKDGAAGEKKPDIPVKSDEIESAERKAAAKAEEAKA